jgi:hypothetical protein
MTDATASSSLLSGAPATAAPSTATPTGALFGSRIDFLLLGGASLLILPAFAIWLDPSMRHSLLRLTLYISIVVNQPHFAHSYQIFYRGFRAKAFGDVLPAHLRQRYLIAGVGVPLALCLFFAASIGRNDAILLGFGANLMYLLVGWHYVKQGYGILIVDSVRKRRPLSARLKKLLWINAIACWIAAWLTVNHGVSRPGIVSGIRFHSLPVPGFVYWFGIAFAVAAALAVFFTMIRDARATKNWPPLNGLVAYVVTLYLWIAFVRLDPLFLLVTPALHSLQYLAVVWRLEINRNGRVSASGLASPYLKLAIFVAAGIVLGYLGFKTVPNWMDAHLTLDKTVFGATPFLFISSIFINVHHYFLDNVSWRGENPEMKLLLSAGKAEPGFSKPPV